MAELQAPSTTTVEAVGAPSYFYSFSSSVSELRKMRELMAPSNTTVARKSAGSYLQLPRH